MRPLRVIPFIAITLVTTFLGAAPADAAGPNPALQMPFPCGQSWTGDSNNSSAHRGTYEIDFNRGGTPTADRGDAVVAAAAGRVVTSAHQGSANGFGNLVKIDHGSGWFTYYAHLDTRSVAAGTTVRQGQKIGTLGNTSKPGNNISPHLHFELRNDAAYPANVKPAYFDGVRFGYTRQTLTSRNCNDAQAICGTGFRTIDYAYLKTAAGAHLGTVYLSWNAGSRTNCVVTVKHRNRSAASAAAAYLQPQGATRGTDSGSYSSYAGPVRRVAPSCVRWGGSLSGVAYNSPSEHC